MQTITNYSSRLASSVHLGTGSGDSHTYVVRFEPGGEIGEHETGFGQLFTVIEGSGWVTSESDRDEVTVGDVIFLPRGVQHAKGSESGMTAVIAIMAFTDGFFPKVREKTDHVRFATPITTPDGASPVDRLVASSGRDPQWSP